MLNPIKFIFGLVLALIGIALAIRVVEGIFLTVLHLLFPVLVLVGAGYLIYTFTNKKALGSGNSRFLP